MIAVMRTLFFVDEIKALNRAEAPPIFLDYLSLFFTFMIGVFISVAQTLLQFFVMRKDLSHSLAHI